MPDWLSNDGRALWCSLIDLLGKSGVATAIDTAELTGLCEWWGRYRAASRELDKIEDRRSTEYYRVQILAGQAWKLFDGIAAKFGLNPSDRAKLRFDSSQNLADPLLEFTQANQEASG